MKTTVDLEAGLFKSARKLAIDQGRPFRAVLNDALRAYLGADEDDAAFRPRRRRRQAPAGAAATPASGTSTPGAEFWAIVNDRSRWDELFGDRLQNRGRHRSRHGRLGEKEPRMNRVALDTNVLVMVFREDGAAGNALRATLASRSAAGTSFAIPVFCIGEFWRVATDRRAMTPVPPIRALAWTDWLLSQGATLLTPGPDSGRSWRLCSPPHCLSAPMSSTAR